MKPYRLLGIASIIVGVIGVVINTYTKQWVWVAFDIIVLLNGIRVVLDTEPE